MNVSCTYISTPQVVLIIFFCNKTMSGTTNPNSDDWWANKIVGLERIKTFCPTKVGYLLYTLFIYYSGVSLNWQLNFLQDQATQDGNARSCERRINRFCLSFGKTVEIIKSSGLFKNAISEAKEIDVYLNRQHCERLPPKSIFVVLIHQWSKTIMSSIEKKEMNYLAFCRAKRWFRELIPNALEFVSGDESLADMIQELYDIVKKFNAIDLVPGKMNQYLGNEYIVFFCPSMLMTQAITITYFLSTENNTDYCASHFFPELFRKFNILNFDETLTAYDVRADDPPPPSHTHGPYHMKLIFDNLHANTKKIVNDGDILAEDIAQSVIDFIQTQATYLMINHQNEYHSSVLSAMEELQRIKESCGVSRQKSLSANKTSRSSEKKNERTSARSGNMLASNLTSTKTALSMLFGLLDMTPLTPLGFDNQLPGTSVSEPAHLGEVAALYKWMSDDMKSGKFQGNKDVLHCNFKESSPRLTTKARAKYSNAEKAALMEGVNNFGRGSWRKIQSEYQIFGEKGRSNTNLKDLYRTLTKDKDNGNSPNPDGRRNGRKRRKLFTDMEKEVLKEGVNRYGKKWSTIYKHYPIFGENGRTPENLKDLYRNLEKKSKNTINQSRMDMV